MLLAFSASKRENEKISIELAPGPCVEDTSVTICRNSLPFYAESRHIAQFGWCQILSVGTPKLTFATHSRFNELSHLLSNTSDYIWDYVSFLQYLSCNLWSFVMKINQIPIHVHEARNDEEFKKKKKSHIHTREFLWKGYKSKIE